MNKIKYITLLLVIAFTSSCSVRKYHRPDLPVETTFRNAADVDTTTLADLDWKTYYQDSKLIALIDSALKNNANINMAMLRIDEAKAYYRQSKAAFFPNLNLGASGGASRLSEYSLNGSAPGIPSPLEDYKLGFSSSWEIDIWGKLRSAKKSQKAALLQTESAKDAVQTELIASIAKAYYDLLSYDAKRDLILKTIKNREESLETVKALKESSKLNQVSVDQAIAQLYNAQGYLPELERAISMTENYISILLNEAPHQVDRGTLSPDDDRLEYLHVGVPVMLLEKRPDVRMAEYSLIAAHQNENVARSQFYPALTITGNFGANAFDLNNWFTLPGSIFGNILGGITQPIFNQGKLKAQKDVAKSKKEQAAIQFKYTLLNAQREVADALTSYQKLEKRINLQNQEYAALTKARDASMELLRNGYGTYLEVLYAQDRVLATEQTLIDSYKTRIYSKIDLYRALGGGWK